MATANTSTAYLGLGSNLENPPQQIRKALQAIDNIPATRISAVSGLYTSKPLVPPSGSIAQPDYYNAVVRIETGLDPHQLLDQLQRIEQAQHRKRMQQWGPRTIDLDILMFNHERIHDERLIVPHPGMQQRAFVLYPLQEIERELEIPGRGMLGELIKCCPQAGLHYLGTIEGYEV